LSIQRKIYLLAPALKNFIVKSKFKTRIQIKNFCNHLKFNLQFLKNITKLVLPCWSKKKFENLLCCLYFKEVFTSIRLQLKTNLIVFLLLKNNYLKSELPSTFNKFYSQLNRHCKTGRA